MAVSCHTAFFWSSRIYYVQVHRYPGRLPGLQLPTHYSGDRQPHSRPEFPQTAGKECSPFPKLGPLAS